MITPEHFASLTDAEKAAAVEGLDPADAADLFRGVGAHRQREEQENAALVTAWTLYENGLVDEVALAEQLNSVSPALAGRFVDAVKLDYDEDDDAPAEDVFEWEAQRDAWMVVEEREQAQAQLADRISSFETLSDSFRQRNPHLRLSSEDIGKQLALDPTAAQVIASGTAAQQDNLLTKAAQNAQRLQDIAAEAHMTSAFGRRSIDPTVQGYEKWDELAPERVAQRLAVERFNPDGSIVNTTGRDVPIVGQAVDQDEPVTFAERPSGWTKGGAAISKDEMLDGARAHAAAMKDGDGYFGELDRVMADSSGRGFARLLSDAAGAEAPKGGEESAE